MKKYTAVIAIVVAVILSGCSDWEKVTPRMEDAEAVTPPKKYDYSREEMRVPLKDSPSPAHVLREVDRRFVVVEDNKPETLAPESVGLSEPGWRYVAQMDQGDCFIALYVRFDWVDSAELPRSSMSRTTPLGPQGVEGPDDPTLPSRSYDVPSRPSQKTRPLSEEEERFLKERYGFSVDRDKRCDEENLNGANLNDAIGVNEK